ncbi:hypothetical protein NQZ68_008751 [Dissostichus eleginoides]|nr:hypothetical protein NQZ68_008751 [Dissostichus eleginoides]
MFPAALCDRQAAPSSVSMDRGAAPCRPHCRLLDGSIFTSKTMLVDQQDQHGKAGTSARPAGEAAWQQAFGLGPYCLEISWHLFSQALFISCVTS